MPKVSRHKTISKKRTLELKPWLDSIIQQVEVPSYIDTDPICFLHAYDQTEDRLIAGFFAAIMAWGRRDIVIRKVAELLERMDHSPAVFINEYNETKRNNLIGFKHRTFTEDDVHHLISTIQTKAKIYGSFYNFWKFVYEKSVIQKRDIIAVFHECFFETYEGPTRTKKHIANSEKNSSCKRLYLYLRWTTRPESCVDMHLLDFIPPSILKIPLDVHVARQARKLGLLGRKQNDWKAVEELTKRCQLLDPEDPSKYDYALFGIGVLNRDVPEELVINKGIE